MNLPIFGPQLRFETGGISIQEDMGLMSEYQELSSKEGLAKIGSLIPGSKWHEGIQQGLKPVDFIGFIGTTEVVPCYKTWADGFFPQPVIPHGLNGLRTIRAHRSTSTLA
jgi:hypothetical protein